MDRCHVHHTRLIDDPIRGLICEACDAETVQWPSRWLDWLRATWLRLTLRWRR